ncbi:FAS1 domain-containing protein [Paraphoma chrysanthemicola]|nr:FAS1 domain-containing protein [Paraphoma chrysanthemicola]
MWRTILTLSSFATSAVAQNPALVSALAANPDLSTLASALSLVTSFAGTLNTDEAITILAPTNSAFETLLAGGLNAESQAIIDQNPDGIETLLAYHVIRGTYVSTDFTEVPTYVNTRLNQSFSIFDTIRTNVTDGQNVGLVLNGDDATIISGELQTSTVVQADIQVVPNITIHKIDRVLTIPLNLSDTLVRLPQLSTSAALGALDITGLLDRVDVGGESSQLTLDTAEDITVFIPNNAAFLAIGSLLQNASNETLRSVLGYHAVAGSVVFASDITNTTVESAEGSDLTLSVGTDGTVYVDNARVVFPNILLSNGVAHIIDAVLNPDTDDIDRGTLNPTATLAPAFTGASFIGTNIPFTQSAITPSTIISIPPLATTAKFVVPGGANATVTGGATGTGSRTVSATGPPIFTGGANKVGGGLGAAMGLGMAMLL